MLPLDREALPRKIDDGFFPTSRTRNSTHFSPSIPSLQFFTFYSLTPVVDPGIFYNDFCQDLDRARASMPPDHSCGSQLCISVLPGKQPIPTIPRQDCSNRSFHRLGDMLLPPMIESPSSRDRRVLMYVAERLFSIFFFFPCLIWVPLLAVQSHDNASRMMDDKEAVSNAFNSIGQIHRDIG